MPNLESFLVIANTAGGRKAPKHSKNLDKIPRRYLRGKMDKANPPQRFSGMKDHVLVKGSKAGMMGKKADSLIECRDLADPWNSSQMMSWLQGMRRRLLGK